MLESAQNAEFGEIGITRKSDYKHRSVIAQKVGSGETNAVGERKKKGCPSLTFCQCNLTQKKKKK